MIQRRPLLALAAAALAGCAAPPSTPSFASMPPIVFVHGNGDTAALWLTTVWRFESNGWPRERLHAIDLPDPLARDDDAVPQPGRSSTAQHAQFLAAEVERVLARTGAPQVVLVANSRGGYAVRNYIANLGGAAKVSHAVLGGVPNHGVWAIPTLRPGNEFNGAGPFLTALNAPRGPNGDEVTPGVRWLTLRSDHNDKFAQPDGVWMGAPGTPTRVTYDGPALKGATNLVLPGRDHREVSFHPQAFEQTYAFITGRAPATTQIVPQARVVLDGTVSGQGPAGQDNRPLAGATLEVYAVDAATGARRGAAAHRKTLGADGRWGPYAADGAAALEFVITAPGHAVTHIYRSPFPRSSSLVNLRAERLAEADRGAGAVVVFTRPRGYFGVGRDRMSFDGASTLPGVPAGVPGLSTSKLRLPAGAPRSVAAEFNGERIAGMSWPAADNHIVLLELHQ